MSGDAPARLEQLLVPNWVRPLLWAMSANLTSALGGGGCKILGKA